jgi:hypothetical protein
MSSVTPASRIATTRWLATAAKVIMANSQAGVGLVKRASVVVCRAAEHLRDQQHPWWRLSRARSTPSKYEASRGSRRTRS